MAERKVDLPKDLLASKLPDEPWAAKDDICGGNYDEKVIMGFLDDSKDQVISENSIPLSPQWLYSRHTESKANLVATSGFKELSKCCLIEARWFNAGYVPTYEEYMSVALVTCGYKSLTVNSFVGMGDIATKEAFEWTRSMPKLIKAVSVVCRLQDDITSNKMEQERGHVVSSIEVYMKEHGGTYEETCTKFREMVADAWKDINEECLKPTAFPMALLIIPVNLARVIEVLYQHGDGYTESTHETKERISLVLVNPIPV